MKFHYRIGSIVFLSGTRYSLTLIISSSFHKCLGGIVGLSTWGQSWFWRSLWPYRSECSMDLGLGLIAWRGRWFVIPWSLLLGWRGWFNNSMGGLDRSSSSGCSDLMPGLSSGGLLVVVICWISSLGLGGLGLGILCPLRSIGIHDNFVQNTFTFISKSI